MWQGVIYQPGDHLGTISSRGEAHIWVVRPDGVPVWDDLAQTPSEQIRATTQRCAECGYAARTEAARDG